MDAKAKVVQRWDLIRRNGRNDHMACRDNGKWVLLTDHESALAELREQCVNWQGAAGQYKAELLASELRISTLLSGLEALAGEWEEVARTQRSRGYDEASPLVYFSEQHAKQLRTLASAGLEGNGNG